MFQTLSQPFSLLFPHDPDKRKKKEKLTATIVDCVSAITVTIVDCVRRACIWRTRHICRVQHIIFSVRQLQLYRMSAITRPQLLTV